MGIDRFVVSGSEFLYLCFLLILSVVNTICFLYLCFLLILSVVNTVSMVQRVVTVDEDVIKIMQQMLILM